MAVSVPAHPPRAGLTLVNSPHPLLSAAGRSVRQVDHVPGCSVAEHLRAAGGLPGPSLVALNDRLLAPQEWEHVCPREGDLIIVRAVVHGGDGGKNPLATVLSLALLVVAPYAAAALAPAFGLAAGGIGVQILGGAIAFAGNLVISALFPPPTPKLAQAQQRGQQASPTYSLAGGQNRARPFEPMPVLIGRHRMFPDLGAQPFSEFRGQDQWLYQVFHFGLSEMELSDIRIGSTPIASYQEVTSEISGADGALTLFPGNVDTVAGGGLPEGGAFVERTSSIDATALAIDVAGSLFSIATPTGEESGAIATLHAEYAPYGTTDWVGFFAGSPTTEIVHVGRTLMRRTFRAQVARGQYAVRVRLTKVELPAVPDPQNFELIHDLTYSQLRTYQPDDGDYDGQQRLAVAIRASGQINGVVDRLSALGTGLCEAWTGAAWVKQATRNPAWWFRHVARGRTRSDGRVLYGGQLDDAGLDLDAIKEWGAWCDAKALSCDLVFDQPINVEEMLGAIARCGRAAPTRANGKLGVVWDQAGLPVVQVFGPSNILAGSFRVEYVSGQVADEIVMEFINPDLDWQTDTVRKTVGSSANPARPATIQLFGVTDKDQAGREAALLAARQKHHRRRVVWEADFEGLVANRGDVVALSHDLTQWGQSGRLLAGTTDALTLDREVTFTDGQQHYIRVRYPDGTLVIVPVQAEAAPSAELTLQESLPAAPDDDTDNAVHDYVWQFDPQPTPGRKVKIVDVQPLSDAAVRLSAIDEVEEYYLAELSGYQHPASGTTPGATLPVASGLTVSERLIRAGSSYLVEFTVSWTVTGPYGAGVLRVGFDDAPLAERERTVGTRATFIGQPSGTLHLELTVFDLVGRANPVPVALMHTILGKAAPPATPRRFEIDGWTLSWAQVNEIDVIGYLLRFQYGENQSWGDANPLHDGVVTESPFTPEIRPAGTATIMLKAIDSAGNESVSPAVIVKDLGDPIVANVVETHDEHAGGFTGTKVNATVDGGSGDLIADDASAAMWSPNPATAMWSSNPTTLMWPGVSYRALSYTWSVTPSEVEAGSTMTIAHDLQGAAQRLEYRRQGPDPMWDPDPDTLMWNADPDTLMWNANGVPDWVPWPGALVALNEPFDFRLSIGAGVTRGRVLELSVIVDVPDKLERFDDQAIDAGGTRLPLTLTYTAIRNVQITVQDDAGSAVTARAMDKDEDLGPLIQCFNTAGTAVAGTIDATVQGY